MKPKQAKWTQEWNVGQEVEVLVPVSLGVIDWRRGKVVHKTLPGFPIVRIPVGERHLHIMADRKRDIRRP